MLIPPLSPEKAAEVEIVKGPNIKECPKARPIEENLCADVVLKTGDNITTDHIMPAGSKILPLPNFTNGPWLPDRASSSEVKITDRVQAANTLRWRRCIWGSEP